MLNITYAKKKREMEELKKHGRSIVFVHYVFRFRVPPLLIRVRVCRSRTNESAPSAHELNGHDERTTNNDGQYHAVNVPEN